MTQQQMEISQILALRAGLSVMSMYADEIREGIAQRKRISEDLHEAKTSMDIYHRAYNESTKRFKQAISGSTNDDMNLLLQSIRRTVVIITAICAACAVILIALTATLLKGYTGLQIFLYIFAGLLTLAAPVVYLVRRNSIQRFVIIEQGSELDDLRGAMQLDLNDYKDATERVEMLKKNAHDHEMKITERIAIISLRTQKCMTVLKSMFEGVAPYKYWSCSDLIVYYLENGTADTAAAACELIEQEGDEHKDLHPALKCIPAQVDLQLKEGAFKELMVRVADAVAEADPYPENKPSASWMLASTHVKAETSAKKLLADAEFLMKFTMFPMFMNH